MSGASRRPYGARVSAIGRMGLGALLAAACSTASDDTKSDGETSGSGATSTSSASSPTTGEPGGSSGAEATGSSGTGEPGGPTGGSGTSTGDDTTGATSGSSGPPPEQSVPVFIAQGHYGRTTISCDDGKTWIRDASQDDAVRCFENDLDCDHDAFAGRGIAYGEETFVLTWGWGKPGTVTRTEDATLFETVLTDTPTFADVAYGNGRFVANNSMTQISDDLGKTWQPGGPLDIGINTRAIVFAAHESGWFIVTGESGDQRAIVRSPDGVTWTPATTRPAECGQYVIGAAYGGGTVIIASGQGHVCRSSDGGDNWEHVPLGEGLSSPPVWTGTEFLVYGGQTLYRSPDGGSWQNEQIVGGGSIGPLARSPEGTLVAANSGWMQWYEKQQFFRSTDGVNWETLPPGAFVGSHPIYHIEHGYVQAGCP